MSNFINFDDSPYELRRNEREREYGDRYNGNEYNDNRYDSKDDDIVKIYDVNNATTAKKRSGARKVMTSLGEINIRELDPHTLHPTSINDKFGGCKLVVIGKPGTGKSELVCSLLYHKKHIIPVGQIFSGTEDSTSRYGRIFPKLFVYPKLVLPAVESFIKRQKVAKKYLKNPWAVQLIDDCTDDPKILKHPLFQGIYKNGRQWSMLHILSLQYSMDVLPVIRTCIDGTFILKETNRKGRQKLWENYGGCIPTFDDFNAIMDQVTEDYTALFINNSVQSNNLEDCIFYYKANLEQIPKSWRFGCNAMWDFNEQRYDQNYVDPVVA